jgi:hypothetical protein
MSVPTRWKVLLAALVLGIGALVLGLPWVLYGLGLQAVEGRPEPPQRIAALAVQQQVWQRAGSAGPPEAVALDPVTYLLSASVQARPPDIVAFAWRVASDHSRDHLQRDAGPLRRHLAGAALTIWLTRHWSVEQLLTRVAELERPSLVPSPL